MELINTQQTLTTKILTYKIGDIMIVLYHSFMYGYSSISFHNENGYIFKSSDVKGSLLRGIKQTSKILKDLV